MSRPATRPLYLSFFVAILFLACAKQNPNYVPPTAVDSFVKDAYGSMYMSGDNLYKLNVHTGATEWTTYNVLLFGSAFAPMYFDSGYLYYGGLYGIATYNYQTGAMIWLGNTPATPGMGGYAFYRRVAIQDSLAIYAGSTGVGYGHAYMYCVRKRNGTLVWQNEADSISYALSDFTSIPYMAEGQVTTLTRNANGHTQIAAYDPITGNKRWATADNDNLQARFLIGNDAIYVVNGQFAFCYSAKDGSQLWQTDLESSGNSTANCFLDGNKLIVPNAASQTSCTVSVYSTTNGSLLSSHSFTLPLSQANNFTFNYSNNVLYTSDLEMGDSVNLHAYDINAQKETWAYKYQEAGQYGNIVTPDFVILPEATDSGQSDVTFLSVQGSVVKKIPFSSNYIDQLLYTDSTGAIYRQP